MGREYMWERERDVERIQNKTLRDYLIVTAGTLLLTVGVYFFKFPNQFSTGGVSGFATIFGALIPGLTPGSLVFIINMALLVVAFLVFGRGFGAKTVYSSVLFSVATWLLERVYPMDKPFTSQPFLELIIAVLLPAIGSALLFNVGASSGGTDIIAMILKKYTHMDIGRALLVSDVLIAASACLVFNMETGLFSIMGLCMKAFMVDYVVESINMCKYITVVTTKPEELCDYIIHVLNHGATVMDARGAFSGQGKQVILVACKRYEALRLRQKVREVDPSAFLFITNTSEIIGKGFRSLT